MKKRRTIYRRWSFTLPPAQLIKTVWGLGINDPCVDMTLIGDNSTLMNMDAPNIIPAGSTWREEYLCDDGTIYARASTRYVIRRGAAC